MPEWLVGWCATHNALVIFLGVWFLDWATGLRLAIVQGRFRWRSVGWGLRKLGWLAYLMLVDALIQSGVAEVDGVPIGVLQLLPLRGVARSLIQNLEALGYSLRLPPAVPSKRQEDPRP